MKRRLLNLLTALSSLLCVAAVALWPVSYSYYTAVGFWPSPQSWVYGLVSHHGSLCLIHVGERNRNHWAWRHERSRAREPLLVGAAGFTWRYQSGEVIVAAPYWLLAILLATPTTIVLVQRRRGRVAGVCAFCGYDLRATPHRCPECGTAATTPA